jgi:hypothetical protein
MESTMAPDGSFLVFASNRPADERGKPLDGNFNGKIFPGGGGNLWRVDRVGDGWGQPKRLPETKAPELSRRALALMPASILCVPTAVLGFFTYFDPSIVLAGI